MEEYARFRQERSRSDIVYGARTILKKVHGIHDLSGADRQMGIRGREEHVAEAIEARLASIDRCSMQ